MARLELLESGVPGLKSQMVDMEERVESLDEETKSIHKGLVSLQFQAERQQSGARAGTKWVADGAK